ncbi:MAG: response regulator [Bacteroidetes bacterium]|nr:response regulator [Bacteroidota bacterium]
MEVQSTITPGSEITIMLIDSCEIDNFVNKRVLELYGLTKVISFTNPEQALLYLQNSNTKVDLILTEIYLPMMDGFQLIDMYNNLKLGETHGQIILLSATLNPIHKSLSEEKNVRFIEKPLTISKLALTR